jgi:hypothetical protein
LNPNKSNSLNLSIVALILSLVLCAAGTAVVIVGGITNSFFPNIPAGNTQTLPPTPQINIPTLPPIQPPIPTQKKEVEVLKISKYGKNQTKKFELTGGEVKVNFSFSNNKTCYGIYCAKGFAGLTITCSKSYLTNYLLQDIIAKLNKTYTLNNLSGSCYAEINLQEGVKWNLKITEQREVPTPGEVV